MTGTVWHCYIAASLDGKIARADGGIDDWLVAEYPVDEFGYDAFYASVDAILMGRGTYEAVRGLGGWPYAGKPTTVMTTRPLRDPPPDVEARSGDLSAVAEELEGRGCRRVWILGGGQVIRSMIAIGRFDVLEMALIPRVLGDGVPLFPEGTEDLRLRLVMCEAKTKGALHLLYERMR